METIDNPDGTTRERPVGCPVDGCWHNYAVPTKGVEVRRSARHGLVDEAATAERGEPTGPVVWSDADGMADCCFVSDPLADDLVAVEFEGPMPREWKWDTDTLTVVEDVAARERREVRERVAVEATVAALQAERKTVKTKDALDAIDEQVATLNKLLP